MLVLVALLPQTPVPLSLRNVHMFHIWPQLLRYDSHFQEKGGDTTATGTEAEPSMPGMCVCSCVQSDQ
eukprot:2657661-Amphidinium_carterae.1